MKISLIGYEANIKNRVGSNQYAFELMTALYKRDHHNQYTVFLPTPPLPDLPPARTNWKYQVSGPKKFWNFFGLPLALYQQKPKADIVFNPGHYCPLFFPSPLVISIMDLGYLRFPKQFTKPTYWKLRLWTALSIKRAKQLLTISQTSKNDIINKYEIAENKITVTYPGFDETKFCKRVEEHLQCKQESKRVKEKYGINGKYILFLSTLKPNKNIEGLVEAYKLLKTDLILVIAGKKGWLYETIFEKVKQLKLEEKVIFTDFVPEDDVPAMMQGAEVFVLPSFWEGFGIPVVEAMACGVPVVVSNAGSLPEIVGEAGIIVDPYNVDDIAQGINKAIENKTELVKKGLEQIKKFSWDRCAEQTLTVLEKL